MGRKGRLTTFRRNGLGEPIKALIPLQDKVNFVEGSIKQETSDPTRFNYLDIAESLRSDCWRQTSQTISLLRHERHLFL